MATAKNAAPKAAKKTPAKKVARAPLKEFKVKARVEVTRLNGTKVKGYVIATKKTPTGPFYQVDYGGKVADLKIWARPIRMRAF